MTVCGCGHNTDHTADGCTATWVKYDGTANAYPVRCGCRVLHTQTLHGRVGITLTRAVEAERERRALSGS